MANIWDSIKDTVDVLKASVDAPHGLVLDLSSMAFGDDDLTMGNVVSSLSKRSADLVAPVYGMDPTTQQQKSTLFGSILDTANWALDNLVNEPIAAGAYMASHLDSDNVTFKQSFGELLNGDAWGRAYQIAQENGAGEALSTLLLTDATTDPLEYDDPYDEVTYKQHPKLGPAVKWGVNVAGAWYLDPFVIAGKGLGAVRSVYNMPRLSEAQGSRAYKLLTTDARDGLGRNAYSRTEKWIDWIEGKNSLSRPLYAHEILHGTPELKKYAAEPHVIAGLLEDTRAISDPLQRRDAMRRIMAVAAGDSSQINRLRSEVTEAAYIADALTNMAKGGTLDLKLLGAAPTLRTDPRFIAHLDSQLANLNKDGAVEKFIDGWEARLAQQLGIQHTMDRLPGIHNAGERAVNRLNDKGALRAVSKGHRALDDWAAKHAANLKSSSSVFQRAAYTVPIVAVKTVGLAASPYTKAPVAISDALRQVQFTGVAHIDDWGGATQQLDSLMALGGVTHGDRWKALSKAYLAKSEPEKARVIEEIESLAMKSLAREYSTKLGRDIDEEYITGLMTTHAQKRGASLAHVRGRVYATTPMPDEMLATRMGPLNRAADEARGKAAGSALSAPQRRVRVDQINDDGTPLALPLLETQLTNSIPLFDVHLARKIMDRDASRLSRLSQAWKEEAKEFQRLSNLKGSGARGLDNALEFRRQAMDYLMDGGQKLLRGWKFSVLFRLGYPMRVLMDDHMRIWTQVNALSFYTGNGWEGAKNFGYNQFGRAREARVALHDLRVRRQELLDELDGDLMATHSDRLEELRKLRNGMGGVRGHRSKLQRQLEEAEAKRDLGLPHGDISAIKTKLDEVEANLADRDAAISFKLEQLGERSPDMVRQEIEQIESMLLEGVKGQKAAKRTIGQKDVVLDSEGSLHIPGAFAGDRGAASYAASSSRQTFDTQLRGVEDRTFQAGMGGSHRTYVPGESGHLEAWADALNHQIRQSDVAMHFVKGGDIDSFVKWIKQPEQAPLRQRLAHYAHDPEDWGGRVQAMIADYVPTKDLADALASGRVTARQLNKMFLETERPSVHGRSLADNLGTSGRAQFISKAMNRVYRMLGEMPTDHLSRHPFFSTMYRHHAKRIYKTKLAGKVEGEKFTPEDLADIERASRKLALHDLRRTLFDISAHSHAAHVMRFVSPFFAAHQEALARWWRIVGDDPSVIRRFTLGMDLPRHLGLAVDEDGNLVKPGDAISFQHRWLLQLPKEFGGDDTDPDNPDSKWSKWSINENAFNLVLQSGITNPGAGPLVAVPMAYLANKYADEPEVHRVNQIFNPYPPSSPMAAALPATFKRVAAFTYGATGKDITFVGVGPLEYNMAYEQSVQDLMVDFRLEHGREPNRQESKEMMLRAGRETNVQMFHRILWNAASPAPALPGSKYSIIQAGWRKIAEQAKAEGKEFDWAYARFKAKWGEAYMPLVYSASNNPASLESTPGTVAALRRYRGVLDRIDPALTRMVVGPYAADLAEQDAVMGEYSNEARNSLRTTQMEPGSSDTYYSYDEPAVAMEEQMARRGWQLYGELTGALTARAQAMGLSSYMESDTLMAIKRAGVAKLREENWAFDKDYGTFDQTQFDRYLDDMQMLVKSPALANDPEREDIQVLGAYLQIREQFVAILKQREGAGLGGPDAQANEGIRKIYTSLVGQLVERNTYFEDYMFNGTLERDPLLIASE